MWPPIEAGSPRTFLGLPAIIWGILSGCVIILILILAIVFICCWLLPRRRKFLSPNRYNATNSLSGRGVIMAHHSSVVAKPWSESNNIVLPTNAGMVPPQYSAPPPPPPPSLSLQQQQERYHHHQQTHQHSSSHQYYNQYSSPLNNNNIITNQSTINIPDTHKSMWAVNPLYASNNVLCETDNAYRTRSLPAWGKSKQRPVSTTDDVEELYAKVNFSKKRRNRMRNGEAAIIALCRSRSQNLPALPLEREGVVVYDERTAL